MRRYLRFPFTRADQDGLTLTGIDETPMSGSPLPNQPFPQALRLDIVGDAGAPPRALPLFSGQFGFTGLGAGIVPTPENLNLTDHADWRTVGRLWFKPRSVGSARYLASAMAGKVLVTPNRVFLEPVQITEQFLFETLLDVLPRRSFRYRGERVSRHDPAWINIAPVAFLDGAYWPTVLNHPSDPDQDDMVVHPWPVVPLAPNGSGHLHVSMAVRRSRPDDIGMSDLDPMDWATAYPEHELTDPAHPAYGAVPARLVYTALADELIDGEAGAPVADGLRTDPPSYRRVLFSRTWKPVQAESAWMPKLRARITLSDGVAHDQRLPHHGVVWVPALTPTQPVTVDIDGPDGWSWLAGSLPDVWRQPGRTDPIDLAAGEEHVVVRRPFNEELITERAWTPGGERCVYMTLRRFVRAYTENRVTGGLLNHKWYERRVSSKAKQLHDDAFAGTTLLAEGGLLRKEPVPSGPLTGKQRRLMLALAAFHPASRGGTIGSARPFGEAAYELWLSQHDKFHHDALDGWKVGLGGPAAAEALGFGKLVHDPDRNGPSEAANTYLWLNRLTSEVTSDLVIPAIIQFWTAHQDYERMRLAADPDGQFAPDEELSSNGHSLYALGYKCENRRVTAIKILDQYGMRYIPVTSTVRTQPNIPPTEERIRWPAKEPVVREVWIGANIGTDLR